MSPKRENSDVCDDSVKNDVDIFVRVSGADSSSEKQNMVNNFKIVRLLSHQFSK